MVEQKPGVASVTVECVLDAAKTAGYILALGVCVDSQMRRCDPVGALALLHGWRSRGDSGDPSMFAAEALGITIDEIEALSAGFEGWQGIYEYGTPTEQRLFHVGAAVNSRLSRLRIITALSESRRASLARDVFAAVFIRTETFGHGDIGTNLAYLMNAILTGDQIDLDDCEFLQILQDAFPASSQVWAHIVEEDAESGGDRPAPR